MTTPTPTLFRYTDGSILRSVCAIFLITVPVWEANRVLDVEHVAALEAAIEHPDHVQGPFTVIKYKHEETQEEEWRIIDGQHRQEVIRRYFAKTADPPDFQVLCRLYNTTDHTAAIKIFKAINNAKPVVYRGSPEERLHDIIQALKAFFISGRTVFIRPGCNRPFLNEAHLIERIKHYRLHERADITPDVVVAHAEAMNVRWAAGPEVCGVKLTPTIWTRAQEYGFYLGLDPKCSWLAGL